MSNAKLGSSYDDKFSGMELGKLRATVAEQADEIKRLQARVEALESEARWRANGAFLDKPDPALAVTEQGECDE